MTNLDNVMAQLAYAYIEKEELSNKIAKSISDYNDAVGKIKAAKRMKEEDGCVIANGGRTITGKIKNPGATEKCQAKAIKDLATYTGVRDKARKDRELGESSLAELDARIANLENEADIERSTDRTNRTTITNSTAAEQAKLADLGISLTNSLRQTEGDNSAKLTIAAAESDSLLLKAEKEAQAIVEAKALETDAEIERKKEQQKTQKLVMILLAIAVVAVGGFVVYKKFS